MTEHLSQDSFFWRKLFGFKLRDNQLCKVIQSCNNYYLGQIFWSLYGKMKMGLILRKGESVAPKCQRAVWKVYHKKTIQLYTTYSICLQCKQTQIYLQTKKVTTVVYWCFSEMYIGHKL